MDYSFKVNIWSGQGNYSIDDIVYLTGVQGTGVRTYYYSLSGSNHGVNPSGVGGAGGWTTQFKWKPSYKMESAPNFALQEAMFGDNYEQRARGGLNNVKNTYNLVFENIDDKKSRAILHFLEQKGGVDPFVIDLPIIYDRTGLRYLGLEPKWTPNSYNLNTVSFVARQSFLL